jgi:hypothetical protein
MSVDYSTPKAAYGTVMVGMRHHLPYEREKLSVMINVEFDGSLSLDLPHHATIADPSPFL